MPKLDPILLRDFRMGRQTKDAVNNFLAPENSVSNSLNVNFDEVVGSAKVRNGTTKLGSTVAALMTPTGLGPFVGKNGTPDLLLATFTGSTNGQLFIYSTGGQLWLGPTTTAGALQNSASVKFRFSTLGSHSFMTNTTDGMKDSGDGLTWVTTNSIGTYKPSLVFRYKARMLAAGDPTYPDRVFFSSVIDPTTSPFITWNVNATTGDWIDINPDDGGYMTGFSETSTFVLAFKNTGMYRLDTISKTADAENIFNVGAVSQEAIVLCQGVTYYFSGVDIRRTNGGFPEQISRFGVQDFINAIPQANWTSVCCGTDEINVYFFIGNVTLNQNTDDERAYSNVVLKFSPRDQSWSTHSYGNTYKFFAPFITTVTAL